MLVQTTNKFNPQSRARFPCVASSAEPITGHFNVLKHGGRGEDALQAAFRFLRNYSRACDSRRSRALVASQPLRQAAATLGVHRNTTLRWRHRFLTSLKADRAATLQGITEADETYFLESHKGRHKLERADPELGHGTWTDEQSPVDYPIAASLG